MKILVIHNLYKNKGGEEAVVSLEKELLEKNGHIVREMFWNNESINNPLIKVLTGLLAIYNPFSRKKISKVIREFKPDVIHVHNFFPQVSPAIFFSANSAKVPVVFTVHNFRLVCSNGLLLRDHKICELCVSKTFPLDGIRYKCYRNSYVQSAIATLMSSIHKYSDTWKKRVNRYVFLTEFSRNKMIRSSLNLPLKKTTVKPNFVFDYGCNSDHDRQQYYLFVGRLSEEKGIEILVNAFNMNQRKLKIIGSGIMLDYVKNNASSNIELLGQRDAHFVRNEMRKCKAVIIPSVCFETFGLTVVEAFSSGTPVICSDIGAPATLVENLVNGLHFKSGSPLELNRKISEFESMDRGRLRELYENARKSYIEQFSPEKNYDMLINIYKETSAEMMNQHTD